MLNAVLVKPAQAGHFVVPENVPQGVTEIIVQGRGCRLSPAPEAAGGRFTGGDFPETGQAVIAGGGQQAGQFPESLF